MEITDSSPDRVEIELAFLKPMRNPSQVEFPLHPDQHRHRRHLADDRRARGA